MQLALGLIETKGLIGAIEAADAATKAANVKLLSKELSTGALVIIKLEGEVAAVKSAVDAGSVAAQRVGQLISAHVIPRPDNQIDDLVYDVKIPKPKASKKKAAPKKKKVEEKSASLFDATETAVEKETIVQDKVEEKANEPSEEIKSEEVIEKVETDVPEQEKTEATPEEKVEVDESVGNETLEPESSDTLPEEEVSDDSQDEKIESEEKEIEDSEIETELSKPDEAETKVEIDIPPISDLEIMNVHQLRKLARSFENFPIKGRDISKANRVTLLDYFKNM